jgi:hypothetical protein
MDGLKLMLQDMMNSASAFHDRDAVLHYSISHELFSRGSEDPHPDFMSRKHKSGCDWIR